MILLPSATANERAAGRRVAETPIHGYVWLSMETARQLGTAFTLDLPGFAQIKADGANELLLLRFSKD